jgi:1-deoxy-D-xylulose-5-phosphate reductoisomerase
MRSALLYALSYPERWESRLPRLDLFSIPKLEFLEPDLERFPCITLAYEALRQGASYPAALNASNEIAVSAFLGDRLRFSQIPEVSRRILQSHRPRPIDDIGVVLEVDRDSREEARHVVETLGTES